MLTRVLILSSFIFSSNLAQAVVNGTKDEKYRGIVELRFVNNKGCTAAVVSLEPFVVLTSRHCLFAQSKLFAVGDVFLKEIQLAATAFLYNPIDVFPRSQGGNGTHSEEEESKANTRFFANDIALIKFPPEAAQLLNLNANDVFTYAAVSPELIDEVQFCGFGKTTTMFMKGDFPGARLCGRAKLIPYSQLRELLNYVRLADPADKELEFSGFGLLSANAKRHIYDINLLPASLRKTVDSLPADQATNSVRDSGAPIFIERNGKKIIVGISTGGIPATIEGAPGTTLADADKYEAFAGFAVGLSEKSMIGFLSSRDCQQFLSK